MIPISEIIQEIPLDQLHPFENHPFKLVEDESMLRTVESVAQFGVLVPLLARPKPEGGYEMIAGHRRRYAAQLAGLYSLPVIVRNLDDDSATILMVDSNLQRETLLPSERAFAYKMKLEALKHQGRRTDLTSAQVGQKSAWAVNQVADQADTSRMQIQRYIRLTELIPPLLNMVDEHKIALNPAVELSFLPQELQTQLLDAIAYAQATPSLSQAQRLKKLHQDGKCTPEAMCAVLSEEKKSDLDRVTLRSDVLRTYFPKSYTPKQMENTIITLLQQWQRKRQRDHAR